MTPADSSQEEMSKSTILVNAQGCCEQNKQRTIVEDALRYDLQILGLTETHVKDEGTTTITVKQENNIKRTYQVFFTGIKDTNTFPGTGIAIEDSRRPHFLRITDRIATANCQLDEHRQANIIVDYAPTLLKSEKDPQIQEDFYNELDKTTSKHKKNKHLDIHKLVVIFHDF